MTLSVSSRRNDYTGNGAVDTYAYGFKINDQDDLTVIVRHPTTDVETTLTIATDYTVTGVGTSSGGNVVLVDNSQAWIDADGDLDSSWHLTILGDADLTQDTSIRNQGAYYAGTHEDVFDKLVMALQELKERLGRTISLPNSFPASSFDPKFENIPAAGDVPVVNSAGDGFEFVASVGSSTVAAAASAAAAAASAASAAGVVTTHAALTATHGVAGAIVGTTDAQSLTNKVIVAGSNTISGITNAMKATMPAYTVSGNNTAAAAAPIDLTLPQAAALMTFSPSYFEALSGSGTYNLPYWFVITSGSATIAATYTNNGVTYTVLETVASGTRVRMSGNDAPTASGTLTKASGTGDATLTFHAVRAPSWLEVELIGGGGGGGGAGNSSPTAGGTGGNSSFGTTLLVGNGGGGGGAGTTGGGGAPTTPGTASIGAGAIGIATSGGSGQGGSNQVGVTQAGGGGAGSPFAGGCGGGIGVGTPAIAAAPNTGVGGGGAGGSTTVSSAAGGSAGGYARGVVAGTLSATYPYAVGAAGATGTGGGGGVTIAGAAGSAGRVNVWAKY